MLLNFHRADLFSVANTELLDPKIQISTIMSSENTMVIRRLGNFTMIANKRRDSRKILTCAQAGCSITPQIRVLVNPF